MFVLQVPMHFPVVTFVYQKIQPNWKRASDLDSGENIGFALPFPLKAVTVHYDASDI